MKIVLENLTKVFPSRTKGGNDVVAVNDMCIEIPDGEHAGHHGSAQQQYPRSRHGSAGVFPPLRIALCSLRGCCCPFCRHPPPMGDLAGAPAGQPHVLRAVSLPGSSHPPAG